jgi:hypothetical protein
MAGALSDLLKLLGDDDDDTPARAKSDPAPPGAGHFNDWLLRHKRPRYGHIH